MDFLDAANGQRVTRRRAAELIRTVACAHGNSQGVDTGRLDEIFRLLRVGKHLIHRQHAFRANPVLFAGHACF